MVSTRRRATSMSLMACLAVMTLYLPACEKGDNSASVPKEPAAAVPPAKLSITAEVGAETTPLTVSRPEWEAARLLVVDSPMGNGPPRVSSPGQTELDMPIAYRRVDAAGADTLVLDNRRFREYYGYFKT